MRVEQREEEEYEEGGSHRSTKDYELACSNSISIV